MSMQLYGKVMQKCVILNRKQEEVEYTELGVAFYDATTGNYSISMNKAPMPQPQGDQRNSKFFRIYLRISKLGDSPSHIHINRMEIYGDVKQMVDTYQKKNSSGSKFTRLGSAYRDSETGNLSLELELPPMPQPGKDSTDLFRINLMVYKS